MSYTSIFFQDVPTGGAEVPLLAPGTGRKRVSPTPAEDDASRGGAQRGAKGGRGVRTRAHRRLEGQEPERVDPPETPVTVGVTQEKVGTSERPPSSRPTSQPPVSRLTDFRTIFSPATVRV